MTTETSPRLPVHQADRIPLLDPLIELYRFDSENVILKADEDYLRVRGPAISDLLMALDGATPTTTLARIYGAERIDEVLRILERRGLLACNDQPPDPSLLTAVPRVVGCSVIATCPVARWFASTLGSVTHPLRADARIVITDSYLRPELTAAWVGDRPWLLVKVGKGSVWVSPVFAEGRAPCWNCVRIRLLARDDTLALLLYGGYRQVTRASSSSPSTGTFGRESVVAVAAQIERQLTGLRDAPSPGCLVRITQAACVSMHPIAPTATCVACGRSTTARGGGTTQPGIPRLGGRGAHLWHTVQTRLGSLLDPITGVISEHHVYPPTPDNAVAVAVASYANPSPGMLVPPTVSTSSDSFIGHPAITRFAFGGGVRTDDARARAVLEAVERYCTSGQGDESDCHASLADLGDSAFHPNNLMCFDASQLARERPSATRLSGEQHAPLRYTEDISLRWCTAVSLTGVERWLPLAYCYRVPDADPDSAYCVYDSNGSAVAFSMDDAIVSGFLEVVERDAVAIWWYNKVARPVVDIESFGDGFFADVAARERAVGSRLSVFDVTGDLEIPTFVAMSVRQPGDIPLFGFGAHFNARSALRSALVELGQAIRFHKQESRKWAGFDWSGQSHLTAPEGPPRRAEHYHDAGPSTVRECAAAAAGVGAEIFVRDCTRADIGLPCVKVIVPGLRGIRPRFGPGRLFDVPARMGWLTEPRTRRELNTEYLRS